MSNDTTIIWLPLDDKPRQECYRAGRRGVTGAANPYPIGTAGAHAWLLGLADGRMKPLRPVTVDG